MAVNDPFKLREIYNQENNIYVESDYDNIIVIDPNKVVGSNNVVRPRNIQQENLVFYANLETTIIPRTKLAIGDTFDSPVMNTMIASLSNFPDDLTLNFLRPKGKKAFDTSWSDEFTGKGSAQGKTSNQNSEYTIDQDGNSIFKRKVLNYEDTQLLGITNILVDVKPIDSTQATIEMVDIRGRALFEQGDNSLYSVFFNLPYPPFFLTLKGYYGKAIRYKLSLLEFNAEFEPTSGNFKITLKLMGRNKAILADSILAYGKHSPKMFQTETTVTKIESNGSKTNSLVTGSLGLQKMKEVYAIYKSKGLIAPDFPELTIEELDSRIQALPVSLQEELNKADFTVMNDVADFETNLIKLRNVVFADSITKFLDTSEKLYKSKIYYPFLENISFIDREKYTTELKSEIEKYVDLLTKNKSFGTGGSYKLPTSGVISGEIPIDIKYSDIYEKINYDTLTDDDFKKTYAINYGSAPTTNQLNKFISDFKTLNPNFLYDEATGTIKTEFPDYFKFGDLGGNSTTYEPNSFLDKILKANNELTKKSQLIEKELTDFLSNSIINNPKILGFTPTIRNVCAILFAGLDGFYRLMEDTHTSAWNQRTNPSRIESVIPASKNFGVDSKNLVSGTNLLNNENVVYPWPQYFITETQKDGSTLYVIKYPGDPTVINATKGNNFVLWPEVAFTEEFIKASLQTFIPPSKAAYVNPKLLSDILSINAVEYPFTTVPYSDTQEVNYLYEIFERSYLGAHYGKLNRTGFDTDDIPIFLGNLESQNIELTAINNPQLTKILKELRFTYPKFLDVLKTFTSKFALFSESIFVTTTINNLLEKNDNISIVDNYNAVYSIDTLSGLSILIGANVPLKENIKRFINSVSSNGTYFLDNYPFTDINWLKNNVQKGQNLSTVDDFNNTLTYVYLDEKKTISRVDPNKLTMLTYYRNLDSYIAPTINNKIDLKNFYTSRINETFRTESICSYGNLYDGQLGTNIQTTSLLNTPYFVNAMIKGVDNHKNNVKDPYVALGYLYLNSLPLISTREKIHNLDTSNGVITGDVDYLAATFNKFSAIHQLPYAWVLKYGSIWHRYKKFIENSVDILDNSIWSDFDYLLNYDQSTQNPSKIYKVRNYKDDADIDIQLQNTITIPNTTNTLDNISFGFYPKIINDVFWFFENTDLNINTSPNYANFVKDKTDNGLNICTNSSANNYYNLGFDSNNPTRSLYSKNYYVFTNTKLNDYLLIPSTGGLSFSQMNFECFDDSNKIKIEVFNNKSAYNGSVRPLWGLPQFGYFNNTLIKKPNYNEYLKVIHTDSVNNVAFELKDTTSTYSNIEEIFAIFEPEILDKFEKLFLNFCNPIPSASDLILESEIFNGNVNNIGRVNNLEQKRLFDQMKNLFIVKKTDVTLINDETLDGISLANQQGKNLVAKTIEFLNFDCVLKLGNPGNFKRKIFNYFSNNSAFSPLTPILIPPYVLGTLPGDGSGVSLIQSIGLNPKVWQSLKKYVGEFNSSGIKYSDLGSTITDFFIDNQVEFSITNVETLYPLIRLYAKEKLFDNTFNKIKFQQKINNFLTEQQTFNSDILTQTFLKLNSNLPNISTVIAPIVSASSGSVSKLETYTTLKNMNDKWISGTDFKNKTIFEDFLFQDKAGRDVGDEITVNLEKVKPLLKNNNNNYLSLITSLCEDANMIFFALPAYINFYGIQEAIKTNKPIPVDVTQSLFGTFLDVDYINATSKFLFLYVGKPSENVASDAAYYRFSNDSFDMTKSGNPIRFPSSPDTDYSKTNRVVGFSVDYGIQNQNMFKSISIDMSEKKNTAETNLLYSKLGVSASGDKVAQQTVSLYSVYKSRSYTSKIKMLGNVMIQPTMYFNLRHVPLFYGPYLILSVKHDVNSDGFETTIEGVRVPRYTLPKPNGLLESVNQNYLTAYKEFIYKTAKTTEPIKAVNTQQGTVEAGALQAQESLCIVNTQFNTIPFVSKNNTIISTNDFKILLNGIISTTDEKLKPLYYGIAYTRLNNKIDNIICNAPNYNLYEISTYKFTNIVYNATLAALIPQQVCITTALEGETDSKPYASFLSFKLATEFYHGIIRTYLPIIEQLKTLSTQTTDAKKYAEAYSIFTLFYVDARFVGGGVGTYPNLPSTANDFIIRKNDKVNSGFSDILDIYNRYFTVFEGAYAIFF